jgi:hypothetical protein
MTRGSHKISIDVGVVRCHWMVGDVLGVSVGEAEGRLAATEDDGRTVVEHSFDPFPATVAARSVDRRQAQDASGERRLGQHDRFDGLLLVAWAVDRWLLPQRPVLVDRDADGRSWFGAVDDAHDAIDVGAAGHDGPGGQAFEDGDEGLGVLAREGDHVNDDVGAGAAELGGEAAKLIAVGVGAGVAGGRDLLDAWGDILGVVAAVEERDVVALLEEVADEEGAGELGAANDDEFHRRSGREVWFGGMMETLYGESARRQGCWVRVRWA